MPPSAADYKVQLVDAGGSPDWTVSIVGDQVVTISGASPGDVLVVAPDGQTLITAPSATPGAHASTHAAGGSDEVTLAQSQITNLTTDLGLKAPLASPSFTGTVTFGDGVNLVVGSTSGTKLGTATTQKIGFYNGTPIVQPLGSDDVLASLVSLGLRAASSNPPLNLGSGTLSAGTMQSPSGTSLTVGTVGAADTLAINTAGAQRVLIGVAGGWTFADTTNFIVGTTTGLKIGTATNQKVGFYNSTPVVQTTGATDVLAGLVTLGLRAASSNPPLNLGTTANLSAGNLYLGTTVDSLVKLYISGTHASAATGPIGIYQDLTFPTTATGSPKGMHTKVRLAAGSYTTTALYGIDIQPPTIGAGVTVTDVAGLIISDQGSAAVGTATGIYVGAQRNSTAANIGVRIDAALNTGAKTLWLSGNTDSVVAAAGIFFGASADTNLYRSAADTLKTDDALVVGGAATLTGGITDATNVALGTGTGTKIGTATGQKLAFHNSTPVIQRAGASQAAVAGTGSTQTVPFGYTTAAQADAIVTLVNELRAALVEKGLIKGAA